MGNMNRLPPDAGHTVLIVDDEERNLRLLDSLLSAEGYATRLAASGEAALAEARRQPPDLILLDIMMPGIDGFEVARQLKADEHARSIPIVMVTAMEDRESKMRALKAGAEDFLSKPVDHAELLTRVRNLLRLKEYGDFLANHNRILEQQVEERTAALAAKEQEVERVNTALRTLSSCNVALVHARTEEELFRNVCRHMVEIGGHRLAWVSYPGERADTPPVPFAHFGDETLFQRHAELDKDPEHHRHCLTFSALRERKTKLCDDLLELPDRCFGPLREAGVAAILALPLRHGDEIYGALTVLSSTPGAFGTDEIRLAEELAGDLAYGVVTLRTRAERDQGNVNLRQALEQTIAAIALTLEKRDPYTAGHQQRVAEIAAAIAGEMGLSPEWIDGLRFGALIHDIGKVYVPAEILNRPGKLTALEFGLIESHPSVGFDIVKDIPFPWPVAQMVHQHHERIDGSGYPQGLKGEEIILEARILAVADVVEAMAAHRPYRAALGIDAGLAEVERLRGTRFDVEAVDACLRLFREKSFKFGA